MEFLFELVFEIFGEIFLQLIFELGGRSLIEPFSKPVNRNPFLAFFGYALFGLIAGGISVLVFPKHLIPDLRIRTLNLVLTPVAVGAAMAVLGNLRLKADKSVIGIDRFSFGAVFALSMALIRFFFAK